MNRPRRNDRRHWPDYLISRTKPGGKYYSWKHPHTGKEYGLGYSFQDAAAQAREANLALLAERSQKATLLDRITGSDDETMDAWLDRFATILDNDKCFPLFTAPQHDRTAELEAVLKVARDALNDCEGAMDECRDYPITYNTILEALAKINEVLK